MQTALSKQQCLENRVFKVCNTYPCPVAMVTFDLKVYALHSDGILFQLHFETTSLF